jgi:hypothetical protein
MIPTFIGAMLERLKPAPGRADAWLPVMRLPNMRFPNRSTEPKSVVTTDVATPSRNRLPVMQRLLTPVAAGVSAARHLLWYLSYHAAADRRPGG